LFESGQPFNGLGKHGTQLNLNTDTVGNIYIGLPSLKEQTAIANFLDEKTAKIDEAIAIKEQQIELLKERKQIIIQQAVTQGLDPTVPMKDSGVEWIGKIPAHWEMKPLKLHLKKIIDNRGRTPAFGDNGIPMLEVKNITDGDLYPTEQFDKFVIPSVVEKYERDKVAIGDVLISTVGATSGKTVLIKNSPTYFICQNVVGLRPDIDLGSEFLNYTLSAVYFKTSLQMINKGNTVSAAHRLDLKN
jgi:type I restriction enzyme S subunit